MSLRKGWWLLPLLLLAMPASNRAPVEMVFAPPTFDYFAIPYPNDLHRYADGRVDRRRFPVPEDNPVSAHYRNLSDGMDGFGVTEAIFFRFTGLVASTCLPGLEASVKPESPVFLVNVDRASPAYGERVPVYGYFHHHARGPLHNLLAVSPYPGFVLREKTVYAAVVLRSLDPALASSATLAALLNETAAGEAPRGLKPAVFAKARTIYAPLRAYLREQKIPLDDVAAATVYTTGDPTRGLRAIMEFIEAQPAFALEAPPVPYRDHPAFYGLRGSFTSPQFQTGEGSQLLHDGKVFFDSQGRPVVQRTERVPIVVMVPKGKMPADGFPLVIYLHGGANDSNEFLDHIIYSRENAFTPGQGPARVFAERNIAGVSLALPKSPERLGSFGKSGRLAELPFYNFLRPDVMTGNHWQAAADCAYLLRIMRTLTLDPKLCPQTDASAAADGCIRFNPQLFFSMGFSMGGTILGVWSGVEPGLYATIPAGASGHWGLLIRHFTSVPAKPYFFAWLTHGKPSEEMDARWPTISIIEAVLEPCDTIVYAPHVFRRPFPGHPARHVYLAFGANDFYTKAITQNAIATALGLPLAGPVLDDSFLPNRRLLGFLAPFSFPVRGNLRSEDGRVVTAAALQYHADSWTNDGHNVDYNLTETKHQYGCFLRTLIDTGLPTIPPPGPEQGPCQ